MSSLVPVKNLAKQIVVTHEAWPIRWGYDNGSGLIECGEPKFNVPDYFVVVEPLAKQEPGEQHTGSG